MHVCANPKQNQNEEEDAEMPAQEKGTAKRGGVGGGYCESRGTHIDGILGRRRQGGHGGRRRAYIIAKGEIDDMHAVWGQLDPA